MLLESFEESSILIEVVNMIVGCLLLVWPGCIPGLLVDLNRPSLTWWHGIFTGEVLPKFRQTRTNSRLEFQTS